MTIREAWTAFVVLVVLLALLQGVATGAFYAVEAAATGAVLLVAYGWINGYWGSGAARDCVQEAAGATGAIFALLVGATSFTLILRLFGTDRLIAHWLLGLDLAPLPFLFLVLALIMLSALVLDAFEIIFVIIPILAPPLLMRVHDASWAAVAVLLTLQLAFVLPPIGYALMMTRSVLRQAPPLADLLRAMRPYMIWQVGVLVCVLLWPHTVHLFDAPGKNLRGTGETISKGDIQDQIKQNMPKLTPPSITLPQAPAIPPR